MEIQERAARYLCAYALDHCAYKPDGTPMILGILQPDNKI